MPVAAPAPVRACAGGDAPVFAMSHVQCNSVHALLVVLFASQLPPVLLGTVTCTGRRCALLGGIFLGTVWNFFFPCLVSCGSTLVLLLH